jgi:pyrroloquinoline quinone (PQQ) biosynthesis protein C
MRDFIADLKTSSQILSNRYVTALADGSLSREDFVETQIQFFFAVVFFSRPMMALAGRLPRAEMRMGILENVYDEHGHGKLRLSHERTFLSLLARLGVSLDDIELRGLWPCVRQFNTTLAGVCTLDDTFTAIATLGFIEDCFATISAKIGRGIVDRGFLSAEQIRHYTTHQDLDEEHAEGFYRLLREPYAAHPRHRYQIEQGLLLGCHAFNGLYEGLYAARAERMMRPVGGPHSLAEGWYLDTEAPMSSMAPKAP